MFDMSWFSATPSDVLSMLVSSIGIYIVLLVCTRLAGLRSFSKLSSFDFAITVAFGTILASTLLTKSPALLTGTCAMALLYLIQGVVAYARRASPAIERLVGNGALLLMAGDTVLSDNLDKAHVTENDLRGKLRQAGVTHRDQVLAVVFESTGDVSVLRNDDTVEPWIFADIRDRERLDALVENHAQNSA